MTEPYHADNLVTVHHGDCLQHLRDMPDNSVDSIVTDPPYGLSNTGPDKVADTIVRWANGDRDHVPEGRGFMGRPWDAFVPPPAVWDECLRVLKPGGHMLVFAGSRTQDLMGLSIRLAGFELRDSLAWIYGCLSEDSEALTRRGWVRGPELRDDDEVMQWDHTTGRLSWTTPQRIIVKPWAGRMVRLANRHTDQMLTPDHRVYAQVRRHSRNPKPTGHEVVQAGELRPSWQVSLPMAGILDGGTDVDPDFAYLVGWWLTDAWRHGDGKAAMFSQAKPETLGRLRAALAPHEPSEYVGKPRLEQHSAEHTFYVTGDLAARLIAGWPNRELGWGVLDWSLAARRRLIDGLVDGDGSRKPGQHGVSFWSQNPERLDIVLALFLSVGWRAFADKVKGVVHANPRPSTQVQKLHRDAAPDVAYDGLVWCVTVPSGAFVARRNDRPFITGNSGFPKSLDVSKAIDKQRDDRGDILRVTSWLAKQRDRAGKTNRDIDAAFGTAGMAGHWTSTKSQPAVPKWEQWQTLRELLDLPDDMDAEVWRLNGRKGTPGEAWERREVIGSASVPIGHAFAGSTYGGDSSGRVVDLTAPATPEAERWAGWGTSLKPAIEPVLCARKPLAGTVAGNVLEWGTGALNIDASRVCATDAPAGRVRHGGGKAIAIPDYARFESAAATPSPAGRWPANVLLDPEAAAAMDQQSGILKSGAHKAGQPRNAQSKSSYTLNNETTYEDAGSVGGASRFFHVFKYQAKAPKKERPVIEREDGTKIQHCTVKPLALTSWLVTLITPPGGVVLDPFAGSGTTLEAARDKGFRAVGVEADADHCELIVARLSQDDGGLFAA